MKTHSLTGADLNRAVAMALGHEVVKNGFGDWAIRVEGYLETLPDYANDITATWPILEQHQISLIRCDDEYGRDEKGFCNNERIPVWAATDGQHYANNIYGSQGDNWGRTYTVDVDDVTYGATAMEAGLRRVVQRVLGDEVDLP